MTDLRKAAEMALEALEVATTPLAADRQEVLKAQQALRQALAQPEQTPTLFFGRAVYFADPKTGEKLAQPEQNSEAYGYAKRLAEAIWEKHYKEESPHWRPFDNTLGVLTQIDNMTCGLEKAQPEQDPVAYWNGKDMFKRADEVQYVVNWTDYFHYPLYSEPRSCPTCESLARTVMMDQTSHDTAPPSKPLIALKDEEIADVWANSKRDVFDFVIPFARAIEAKLKEKNT